MSYPLNVKRAFWLVVMAVVFAPCVQAQPLPALSFSDEQLKESGWTDTQIAELRATAPEQSAIAKPVEKDPANLSFSSVFDNYQPYDYLPELDWLSANKEVGKIGGWRAYAKQVQEAQKKERQDEGDKK